MPQPQSPQPQSPLSVARSGGSPPPETCFAAPSPTGAAAAQIERLLVEVERGISVQAQAATDFVTSLQKLKSEHAKLKAMMLQPVPLTSPSGVSRCSPKTVEGAVAPAPLQQVEECSDSAGDGKVSRKSAPPVLTLDTPVSAVPERKPRLLQSLSREFRSIFGSERSSHDNLTSPVNLPNTVMGDAGPSRLFADADLIKDNLRKLLTSGELPHEESDNYYSDGCCQAVARSGWFEYLSILMVLLNGIWISIEMDLDLADGAMVLSDAPVLAQVIAQIFCMFFFMEVFIRFCAFEHKMKAFREFSLMLDVAFLFPLVFEAWIMPGVAAVTGAVLMSNVKIFAVFRTIRILRVLRLGVVLRHVPEALVIVRGVFMAARSVVLVVLLIGLMIYVAAITFHVLLDGTDVGSRRFGSVAESMGTLLLDCTLSGSKGGNIMRETQEESLLLALCVFLFVVTNNITLMGVLGGLLVQTIKTVAEVQKEEASVRKAMTVMDELWMQVSTANDDDGGRLTPGELSLLMQDETAARTLNEIGVDLDGLLAAADFIFDQHGGALTKTEFSRMVLAMRGRENATVRDHVETRKFIKAEIELLRQGHAHANVHPFVPQYGQPTAHQQCL